VLEVDRSGSVLSMFDFAALSGEAEGVTIADDGTIYVSIPPAQSDDLPCRKFWSPPPAHRKWPPERFYISVYLLPLMAQL
jgi:hypothetical protein